MPGKFDMKTGKKFHENFSGQILFRAANWVGDAIMTTPVLRGIRMAFPKSKIIVLAKPWVVPVYQHNPHVDEVMVYESQGRHSMGRGTFRLISDLKARKFDMAILMQNAFEAAFLAFFARIPIRIGYNTDGRTLLLNYSVRMDKALKKKHLIFYYLGILDGAGISHDGPSMELCLCNQDRSWAKDFLVSQGWKPGDKVMGINPGATGGTAKKWIKERYAQLARMLAETYKTKVLIFGGSADRELGEEINGLSNGNCLNVAGVTSLGQAFALISCLDLFVTNDSGLMHAAAAFDIPQAAVIGSTDIRATAPFSSNAVIVREPVACSPCCKPHCPIDHICMTGISVDRVYDTCRDILDSGVENGEIAL